MGFGHHEGLTTPLHREFGARSQDDVIQFMLLGQDPYSIAHRDVNP
jgi:hypothetical protein